MKENRRSVKDLAYGGLFTALIAAGAFLKITIPVQPVPMHFTLQFFFVLLAGLLLGSKGALFSVCTYLAVGLLGIPVFASGGGLSYLLKPTFGFLMGFAAAGYLTGRIHELHRQNSFGWLLFSAVWGLLADYACGMVWFAPGGCQLETGIHQLLPVDCGRGFCALCAGGCAGQKADAGVFGYAGLTDCAARKGGGP